LDSAAEATAAVLDRGASAESVRFLAGAGAFPPLAGLILSDLGSGDDTLDWYECQQIDSPGCSEIAPPWQESVDDLLAMLLGGDDGDGEDEDEDEDEDDDPLGPDWLHSAAGGIADGAGWAWDGISDGAGWAWGHGGEVAWDFVIGDAIDSCREDLTSVDCAFDAATTIPFLKPVKALKYGDDVVDVFNRGDDVRDTAKTVDKARDATKRPFNGLGPVQRGREAMRQLGLKQNTQVLRINGRKRIPDVYSEFPAVIGEVKNVRRLSYNRQLHDYVDFAKENGIKLDLYVRGAPNPTKLSGPLKDAVRRGDIRLRRRIH
jgi:hypothetical protein